jgi:hypothetical protein
VVRYCGHSYMQNNAHSGPTGNQRWKDILSSRSLTLYAGSIRHRQHPCNNPVGTLLSPRGQRPTVNTLWMTGFSENHTMRIWTIVFLKVLSARRMVTVADHAVVEAKTITFIC